MAHKWDIEVHEIQAPAKANITEYVLPSFSPTKSGGGLLLLKEAEEADTPSVTIVNTKNLLLGISIVVCQLGAFILGCLCP